MAKLSKKSAQSLQDCLSGGQAKTHCTTSMSVVGCHSSSGADNTTAVRALAGRLRKMVLTHSPNRKNSRADQFAVSICCASQKATRKKKLLRSASRLPRTDILRLITEAMESNDLDETLWRSFLAAHFGRTSTDNRRKVASAARLLCGFGNRPQWTWKRVSSNPRAFQEWLTKHREDLKSLYFGNHRKFESKKATALFRVFESFLEWATDHGGRPSGAVADAAKTTPEANFHALFSSLHGIYRMGRTGAFDFLCLLGDLELLNVRPGSCYLVGSTGPLAGAQKLWGERRPADLALLADKAAEALEIPFDVFEDALCMWQK